MTTLSDIPGLRLTTLTDCGGCAAKLGADLLSDALAGLGAEAAPDELIAGLNPPDDAAAYQVSDDLQHFESYGACRCRDDNCDGSRKM